MPCNGHQGGSRLTGRRARILKHTAGRCTAGEGQPPVGIRLDHGSCTHICCLLVNAPLLHTVKRSCSRCGMQMHWHFNIALARTGMCTHELGACLLAAASSIQIKPCAKAAA